MPNKLFRFGTLVLSIATFPCIAYAAGSANGAKAAHANSQVGMPSVCASETSQAAQLQCVDNEDSLVVAEQKLANDQKRLYQESGGEADSDKARDISVPNVALIVGGGGAALSAVLAYSDGRTLTVHAGETIPGGFIVQRIVSSPAEVVLNHKGKQVFLLMGGGSSSTLGLQGGNTGEQHPPAVLPAGTVVSSQ